MNLEELRCYMNWRASPVPTPGGGEAAVGVGVGVVRGGTVEGPQAGRTAPEGPWAEGGRAVLPVQTHRRQVHIPTPTGLACGIRGLLSPKGTSWP